MSFPTNFIWGKATASYQVEGAAYADGKGLEAHPVAYKSNATSG